MFSRMKRVLIVDDDIDLCSLLKKLYERSGSVECQVAASLTEVSRFVEASVFFDLIVLDINLGVNQPDGIDVYHWLRDKNVRSPIVFLTGHAKSHPTVQNACAISDAIVLEKPAEIQKLRNLIPLENLPYDARIQ